MDGVRLVIAGVGDGFSRNLPAWTATVKSLHPDFPVYGSVCEAQEMFWRIVGSENALLWMGLCPDEVAAFVEARMAVINKALSNGHVPDAELGWECKYCPHARAGKCPEGANVVEVQ